MIILNIRFLNGLEKIKNGAYVTTANLKITLITSLAFTCLFFIQQNFGNIRRRSRFSIHQHSNTSKRMAPIQACMCKSVQNALIDVLRSHVWRNHLNGTEHSASWKYSYIEYFWVVDVHKIILGWHTIFHVSVMYWISYL